MTNAVSIAQLGANNSSFTNRIINGQMVLDQRNAGASVTPADQQYTLDRWVYIADQASKCTIEQTISLCLGYSISGYSYFILLGA